MDRSPPRVALDISETPISLALLHRVVNDVWHFHQWREIVPPEQGRRLVTRLVAYPNGFTNPETITFGKLTEEAIQVDGFGIYYPAMAPEPLFTAPLATYFHTWSHQNIVISPKSFSEMPLWHVEDRALTEMLRNAPREFLERRLGPPERRTATSAADAAI